MSTVRDLIKGSLRLTGAIATGEDPTAEELSDGLSVLNDLIDSWSNQKLMIFSEVREQFTVTSGQSSRTMGSGGNFDTARPQRISRAAVIQNSAEFPIRIFNEDQWADIVNKSITSPIPIAIHPQGTYPLETIDIYPVTSASVTMVLYSWKPLSQFAALGDTISLPPGYKKLLRYGLAIDLAPEYGKMVDASIGVAFVDALESIKRMNKKMIYMDASTGITAGRQFNIYNGE